MRKIVITLLALGLVVASSAYASNAVRISQVYGGGGGGSTWVYDYVELFNFSNAPVAIGGWSIQYGSSTGTAFMSSATNGAIIPAGATIPACGYYLIQVGSSGGTGAIDPWPAGGPDLINLAGPAMSASNGKVALVNNSVFPTACSGTTVGNPVIVDAIGYGTSTTCYEGSPTASLTNASVAVRNGNGMIDTDVNGGASGDFTLTGSNFVTIHNSLTPPLSECLIVPTTSRTWGQIKTIYR